MGCVGRGGLGGAHVLEGVVRDLDLIVPHAQAEGAALAHDLVQEEADVDVGVDRLHEREQQAEQEDSVPAEQGGRVPARPVLLEDAVDADECFFVPLLQGRRGLLRLVLFQRYVSHVPVHPVEDLIQRGVERRGGDDVRPGRVRHRLRRPLRVRADHQRDRRAVGLDPLAHLIRLQDSFQRRPARAVALRGGLCGVAVAGDDQFKPRREGILDVTDVQHDVRAS